MVRLISEEEETKALVVRDNNDTSGGIILPAQEIGSHLLIVI